MRIPAIDPAPIAASLPRGPRPVARRRVELVREALRSIDAGQVREVMVDEYQAREGRRFERDLQRQRGRSVNCFSCGRFKGRPSAVCAVCGDDPITHNGDRHAFDEAYYGERRL